ncbi:MAG: hypothetical protein HOU81_06030 [Hamadaea sp.]|uniref:hypothetical protein n=1 Tax=Hamadaea sp. TaxID=2024425 RepID=UPI0017DA4C90|nr:hypothetical protein [Hamadaea sp.]NUR70358.1 hypothetical protein [Hamadaea sp.]NUT20518.1 hypothetical protein [Hamadaea sp.]
MRELASWLSGDRRPDTFPYDAVGAEFRRTGKHFVAKELLVQLDQARRTALAPARAPAADRFLRDFLDVVLDKFDGRYDYQTYLGLSLLRLPDDVDSVRRRHDELTVQLIADALQFELAAASGATELLPRQRPGLKLVTKRYRLGVRAFAPALSRLGLLTTAAPDPAAAAAQLSEAALTRQEATERRALSASMLPVDQVHDEYLFIRVLQGYETTFAALAVELGQAVADVTAGRPDEAAERLAYARKLLDGAAPLFSLMATVQPESFRAFRVHTEGASAIQSRSYKRVESLCRPPDQSRLDSAAYRSVPEVRDTVLAGQPSLAEAYRAAVLGGTQERLLERRMAEFSAALLQWRQTHYRIAVRMLGTRPGTGYTEGTPYLAAVRDLPVFSSEREGT